ncbi:rho-related GTP-binding protein RhoU-like [Osmerus mordax]|uniref:rho-related GTP-binding protein RhoU-like n=1 Tax=Osmerus mordax TaxID=8014 RepID=UPI00350E9972
MKDEPGVSFLNAKMPLGSRPAKHRMHVAHEKNSEHTISCMLIGDGAVGKTSMITSYISNGYPNDYQQTAFDVFTGLVHVDGIPFRIQLLDTAGQDEFDNFRSMWYGQVDVFILCFSVVNPVSFHNIATKWIPQVRALNPTCPIVLIGTQSDLRYNVNILIDLDQMRVKPVVRSQAESLAEKISAQGYVECSALTQKNLKEAFDSAICAALKHQACKKAHKLKLLDRAKTFSGVGWKKLFCFI